MKRHTVQPTTKAVRQLPQAARQGGVVRGLHHGLGCQVSQQAGPRQAHAVAETQRSSSLSGDRHAVGQANGSSGCQVSSERSGGVVGQLVGRSPESCVRGRGKGHPGSHVQRETSGHVRLG